MSIRVVCDRCGKKYRVKDEFAGRRVHCKICRAVLNVPDDAPGQILRHPARERDFELAVGDSENIEAISEHIERHIGPIETVYHELISDLVHIDVHFVPATDGRQWHTLVTSGMSDRAMTVPEGWEDHRFAELMVCLPPEWPMGEEEFESERHYWPIRWLKTLARFPHEYETWLSYFHSVPNGDPPEPFAENTELCGWILLPPLTAPEEFHTLKIDDDKLIRFCAIVPLYLEELELKIHRGSDALLDRFDRFEVSEVVDVARRNTCRKR